MMEGETNDARKIKDKASNTTEEATNKEGNKK
jgi:hypothetical protein